MSKVAIAVVKNSKTRNTIFAKMVQSIEITNCPLFCEMMKARQPSIIAVTCIDKLKIYQTINDAVVSIFDNNNISI